MSLLKYQKARELIESVGGGDFEGPKPESLVIEAEHVLGLIFPPSYRRFLLEMGCGGINGLELLGLINDNFEKSSVPDGIWLTLNLRRSIALDPAYIIVGEGGDGTYYALDTKNVEGAGEAPVIRLSVDGQHSERVADSFGAYLLDAVRAVV